MFLGEWLAYALLAAACWGLVNVLDTFFVEEEVYENASEGMIVSSIFKIVGFLLIGGLFFEEVIKVDPLSSVLSILGGVLLSAAFWFYFRAAFMYNDLSLVQIFWNLSIPMITFLGWWILGERLNFYSYCGIGAILLGAILISLSRKNFKVDFGKFFLLMIPLLIFYSFSQVIMKYVEEVGGISFWGSFPYVCLGQVLFGLLLISYQWEALDEGFLIGRIFSGNWKLFIFSEIIELGGLFFMMLAIAKTPSVAFYATTEAFTPLVVIVMTGIVGKTMSALGKSKSLSEVYKNNHTSGIWIKILATVVMAVGIYLME